MFGFGKNQQEPRPTEEKPVDIKHGKKQGRCHVMTPKEYEAHTEEQNKGTK